MLIPPQSRKLWIESLLWGLVAFIAALGYHYLRELTIDIVIMNRAVAFSGLFLVLLSHALSGLSYFWKIGRAKLGYRKELGVVGFGIVILHAILSTFIFSNRLSSLAFFFANPLPFLFSSIVLLLFTYMFVISNFGIPAKLGAQKWRKLLRGAGYLSIALIIGHVTLLALGDWRGWFTTFSPILPPLSLILVILALATLLLRFALFLALKSKKATVKTTPPHASPNTSLPSQPLPPNTL